MALAPDEFPSFGDPGGGSSNFFDGDFAGARLPNYMDPEGTYGAIQVLRMEATSGRLPNDPFLLRSSVEKCVGAKIDGAFPEGKDGITYALKIRSKNQISKLLRLTSLSDGTGIKIIEHPTLNVCRCVVNCQSVAGLDDKTIEEGLADQGVRNIRRITRRNGDKVENTSTIVLTISGTVIPPNVDFGWIRCKTRPYYPAPMLCYNCWNFGHTSKRCQQTRPTCGTCSKDHVIDKETRCTAEVFCKRCDRHSHSLSSRKCPVYCKENDIQRIRVDLGISYPQARRRYEQAHGQSSFSNVTTAGKDQQIAELSSKVDQLQQEMEKKDRRIVTLESSLSTDNSSMIADLLQKVDLLTSEMKRKDDRIQALESDLQNNSRMGLVRKHGTIEELVSKVTHLEEQLSHKEREVNVLRTIFNRKNQLADSKDALSSSEIPSTQDRIQTAEKTKQQLSQKKEKKQKKKEWQPTLMYESDTSPIPPRQISERTPKRDHSTTDSDDSFDRPKTKITTPDSDFYANVSPLGGDEGMSE